MDFIEKLSKIIDAVRLLQGEGFLESGDDCYWDGFIEAAVWTRNQLEKEIKKHEPPR